jgi:hypothetical protein
MSGGKAQEKAQDKRRVISDRKEGSTHGEDGAAM